MLAVINQEKTIKNIEEFNKEQLKHAETEVKNPLPDKESKFSLISVLALALLFDGFAVVSQLQFWEVFMPVILLFIVIGAV